MSKFFGPAAVVASLSLGIGETIMVTSLGAWAEYRLLWLLLLSVVVKAGFVTYLVGRYTAITGERIGHRLLRVPGPRGWLLLLLLAAEFCSISLCFTALAKPCGNLFTLFTHNYCPGNLSFGAWENIWATLLLATALSLSLVTSYKSLERQQIAICGIIVAGTLIAVLMVRPDFGRLVAGALSFGSFPAVPAWGPPAARQHYALNLVTIIGFVGGGLSGYIAYSSWIGLSGWGINSHPQIEHFRQRASAENGVRYLPQDPTQIARLRALLTPLYWDVGMGAAVLFVVTSAFMASGAAILFPRQTAIGGNAWELLTQQATIWREVNKYLVPVYYVAIVAALWGTLASVPEAISRMTYDFITAAWPRQETISIRRVQWILAAWFFVTSVAITWSGASFGILTAISALVASSIGLTLVFACTLYANLTLPQAYRPHWSIAVGGVVSLIVLLLCAIGGMWEMAAMFV